MWANGVHDVCRQPWHVDDKLHEHTVHTARAHRRAQRGHPERWPELRAQRGHARGTQGTRARIWCMFVMSCSACVPVRGPRQCRRSPAWRSDAQGDGCDQPVRLIARRKPPPLMPPPRHDHLVQAFCTVCGREPLPSDLHPLSVAGAGSRPRAVSTEKRRRAERAQCAQS
jgi:hypothetical protein